MELNKQNESRLPGLGIWADGFFKNRKKIDTFTKEKM